MSITVDTSDWEKGKDYPEWMNEVSLATISKGYLMPGETPKTAYRRVADTIAKRLDRPDLANKFFRYIWKGWLNLASPVLSNTGNDKGLPISCFGIDTPDSIRGIGLTNAELMRLTSLGVVHDLSKGRLPWAGVHGMRCRAPHSLGCHPLTGCSSPGFWPVRGQTDRLFR